MSLFAISLLTLLQSALILAQQEPCPGRFNGQPCFTAEGNTGACLQLYPPCAAGFECKPYFQCQTDQKPLSSQCAEVGAQCLIGDIKASSLGSCQRALGSASLTCAGSATDATATVATKSIQSSTVYTKPTPTSTTADAQETKATGVTDQDRFVACSGKLENADCQLAGKRGKCLVEAPKQQTRKRLRIALRCFETESGATTAATATAATKVIGDPKGTTAAEKDDTESSASALAASLSIVAVALLALL